jgi:hypothetical protein
MVLSHDRKTAKHPLSGWGATIRTRKNTHDFLLFKSDVPVMGDKDGEFTTEITWKTIITRKRIVREIMRYQGGEGSKTKETTTLHDRPHVR